MEDTDIIAPEGNQITTIDTDSRSWFVISKIKSDVRLIIDESEDNEDLMSVLDPITIETDNITESMILQSIDEVHKAAQAFMLSGAWSSTELMLSNYAKGKKAELPSSFIRFVKAKCSDWVRAVFEPIDQDSDEYLMQQSKWAGVRGSKDRPVVAIVPSENGLDMEVYTTTSSNCVLSYVEKATVRTSDSKVVIAPLCYRAVLYTIAKYYLISIGNTQAAALMNAVAMQMIGAQSTIQDPSQTA